MIRDSFASSEPEPIRKEKEGEDGRRRRETERGSKGKRKKPHQKYGRSAV